MARPSKDARPETRQINIPIAIDIILLSGLYSSHPVRRGASSRDILKAERDAAPAAGTCNPAPGRPRPAVRRHDDRLPLEGWTRRGRRTAEAVRIRVVMPPSAPGRTAPGTEIAAGGAPRGALPLRKRERHASQACRAAFAEPPRRLRTPPRFPALRSPRGATQDGRTRRRPNNTGADACLGAHRAGPACGVGFSRRPSRLAP
jgi:hypothetical protein